ncbi:polysaccharide biosynthesis/export family protein [Pseudaestuariivita rosea]|uniref:polysaccharide biosynthesis/export family protein n=1 Tax=Pseudaestuariivita rosea TaxID=2763263 RepID=UPI001ABBC5D3|nr:polysaccharide biosynthesis/export family protein [Pseudaestuariivita rosea]
MRRSAQLILVFLLTLSVAACGLPRSGPNKSELTREDRDGGVNAIIVDVDDTVTRHANVIPQFGFPNSFKNAGIVGSDLISPGDVLGLTIWENVDDGLLAGQGQNATILEEVQVDGNGNIFVPYAGVLKASGKTPEQLRQLITRQLNDQTPDPQVQVRRVAGDGATVTLSGAVGAQGVYAIERPTRKLSAMIARAGGILGEPEIAQVVLVRGGTRGRVWFTDIFENPELDIALRSGDRILVEADTRRYTALGSTGAQTLVPFDTQELTALEALAQVGGLQSNSADPTGLFVLRDERVDVARTLTGRSDIQTTQRMVYVMNLTEPNGLFYARDFMIRDGDTVYVTEAPFTQWNKIFSALTGSLAQVNTISNIGN